MVEQPAKPVDNGEAQPKAAVPVSFCSGKLKELVEDILSVTLRNAGTAIPYLDTQHATVSTASDDDSATQCIADSVGHQIEQYPFEQQRVAQHPGIASNND
jgi:hypothetical protein